MNAYLFLVYFFGSLALVALGQPSTLPMLGPIAAICGLALFWRILLSIPSAKQRFWLSTVWYTAVTLIHFSWMLSHPFQYIYVAYPLLSLFYGVKWGIIGLFITPDRAFRPLFPLFIAALWTCLEWSRLWVLTGSSWNPSGLLLSSNPYTLQMASWVGVYGLTFWVTLTNAAVLQAVFITPHRLAALRAFICIAFPYLLGASTFLYHRERPESPKQESLTLLLVQPAFPIEEWMPGWSAYEAIDLALAEWRDVLTLIAPHQTSKLDLAVLPENVVPFGANTPLFRHDDIEKLFYDTLGATSIAALPPLELPLARPVQTAGGVVWVVSHSYILQGLSNWLSAGVVAGLEDRVKKDDKLINTTSAFYFTPQTTSQDNVSHQEPKRYDKRILVPGEYIPFAFLAPFLKEYGIQDSFTPGHCALSFSCHGLPFGLCICSEETYGHAMRDNRLLGARLLISLSNDGWYPHSTLTEQHFEHARLRSVEMGIPLVRATNTGVTASVSSLGTVIDRLQDDDVPGTLLTTIPLHQYTTLYAYAGDWTIISLSALSILAYCVSQRKMRMRKKTFTK